MATSEARRTGADWNREQLQRIDLRWHDLRHEGACRLVADGVDIRIIQLMLGHASIQQTQRYLNVTAEELRRELEVSWSNMGGRCGSRPAVDAVIAGGQPLVRTMVTNIVTRVR
jgi:integrase